MAMKRRSFLTMLGAAVTAPALPVAASSAPAAVVYNRYTYGLGVFHARTHAHVSAAGIARRLRVTPAQAKAMISEMSSAGLVKPVGITGSNVRAISNILKPDAWGLDAARRKARSDARRSRMSEASQDRRFGEPDLSELLAHLRRICVGHGMHLRVPVAV